MLITYAPAIVLQRIHTHLSTHTYVRQPQEYSTCRGQKRVLSIWELELQMFVSHQVGAGNQAQVLSRVTCRASAQAPLLTFLTMTYKKALSPCSSTLMSCCFETGLFFYSYVLKSNENNSTPARPVLWSTAGPSVWRCHTCEKVCQNK